MKVYLATRETDYGYEVVRVFARREHAESYQLGDSVEEFDLNEGSVEVRTWHWLQWTPGLPDHGGPVSVNPHWWHETRDYDGRERYVTHEWVDRRSNWLGRSTDPHGLYLLVEGWDLERVNEVYSEQRAQYIAKKDMGVESA